MIALFEHPSGTILPVRAKPGARENAILGERNGALHVAVTAPPEKGKANAAVKRAVAEFLALRSRVILLAGETSRDKRFLIEDVAPDELRPKLEGRFGPNPAPTP